MTTRIKQSKNSTSCVACVAAMATNTTVEEFKEFVKPRIRGPYTDLHLYSYLLSKGYTIGVVIDCKKGIVVSDKKAILKTEFKLFEYPAYVGVKSHRVKDCSHAVYWDGENIFDPNPYMQDNPDLSLYTILRWYPITTIGYVVGPYVKNIAVNKRKNKEGG